MVGSVKLLAGESMQHRLDGAFYKFNEVDPPLHGKVFLTNFRLIFEGDEKIVLHSWCRFS